jgi:hypothetical protein
MAAREHTWLVLIAMVLMCGGTALQAGRTVAPADSAQGDDESLFGSLQWRSIGPNRDEQQPAGTGKRPDSPDRAAGGHE